MQVQLSTEFALHGLLYLARHQGRQPVQLAEIAAVTRVKESYLRKLFQNLVRVGILAASKGAGGGYSLKSSPAEISFYDVLKAVEGEPGFLRCYKTQRGCGLHPACPIISGFSQAFDSFTDQLKLVTLASVLETTTMQLGKVGWMGEVTVTDGPFETKLRANA
jgi:Rrf2 family protein